MQITNVTNVKQIESTIAQRDRFTRLAPFRYAQTKVLAAENLLCKGVFAPVYRGSLFHSLMRREIVPVDAMDWRMRRIRTRTDPVTFV
jgi:hypothetical protein